MAQSLADATKKVTETKEKENETQLAVAEKEAKEVTYADVAKRSELDKAVKRLVASAAKKVRKDGGQADKVEGEMDVEKDNKDADFAEEKLLVAEKADEQYKEFQALERKIAEARDKLAATLQEGEDLRDL